MAATESPAGARRRVRLAVRNARDAGGFTQSQVAEAMEWSLSKVMRIESGEVTISPNDLRPLLAYLGVTDREVVNQLVQEARTSRRRRMWWDEAQVRDQLTPAMRLLIQYEAEAVAVRLFNNVVVPGRMQTREYARAILEGWRGRLTDDEIEARIDARMHRRSAFLAERNAAEIYLLLDESVTVRPVADRSVTGKQLLDLLTLVRDNRLRVRVWPFTASGPLTMLGAFELLNLPGDTDNAVLYRESLLADELVEDHANVARHREIFDEQWDAALDDAASATLIANNAKSLLEGDSDAAPSRARRRKLSG